MKVSSWRVGLVAAQMTTAGLVVCAQQTAPTPPSQRSTFRLQVNYVEVDAVVTDRQGRFVSDLTRDDFEIRENGVRQAIDVLSLVDLPVTVNAAVPGDSRVGVAPLVVADAASNAPGEEGRVYLLVLDEFHVDPQRTPLVRRRAREFIEQYLQPGDRAAVAHIGYPALNQEFTANKDWLVQSINAFIGEKTTPSAIAVANADPDSNARPDREAGVRQMMAERTVFALGELSKYLAGSRGRKKALVFFSEGLDVDVSRVFSAEAAVTDLLAKLQDAYAAAARAHVAFYTVDPRGVADPQEDLIKVGGTQMVRPENPTVSPAQVLIEQLRVEQNFMRNLAEVTGGLTSVGSGDFARAFRMIVDDNSRYYLLGYHSSDTRLDGKLRTIDVRVVRPGLDVRARKNYFAATPATAGPPADPVAELLDGPVGVAGLGMQITAAAMPGEGAEARVHLVAEVSGDGLDFDREGGTYANDVDLAYRAIAKDGHARAQARETLRLRLDDAVHDAVAELGLRYATEFTLPAGRYQLRVAGLEHGGSHNGSVYLDLDVPAFDKGVVLSDMLLTSSSAGQMPSARPTSSLAGALPGPATASREFDSLDELSVLVMLRNNDARHPELTVTTRVVSDDGREEFSASERRDRREPDGAAPILTTIPLAGMPPGSYVLVIEAQPDREMAPAAVRRTPFRIK